MRAARRRGSRGPLGGSLDRFRHPPLVVAFAALVALVAMVESPAPLDGAVRSDTPSDAELDSMPAGHTEPGAPSRSAGAAVPVTGPAAGPLEPEEVPRLAATFAAMPRACGFHADRPGPRTMPSQGPPA